MGDDQAPPSDQDDLYAALAPVYDDWQRLGGVTPFWALALDHLAPALARGDGAAPVTSFIDLGCGTGELLLALAAQHPSWRLTGVDGSEAMLAVARGKPGAPGVAWVQRDLRALDEEAPDGALAGFAAAGAFHDTLNHLPDAAALTQVFRAVARHVLRPGGLLIFDVTNQLGFARWWQGLSTWRGPNWEIHSQLSYTPAADVPAEVPGTTAGGVPGTAGKVPAAKVPGTTAGGVPGTAGEVPGTTAVEVPGTTAGSTARKVPGTAGEVPGTTAGKVPGTTAGKVPGTTAGEVPGTTAGEVAGTGRAEVSVLRGGGTFRFRLTQHCFAETTIRRGLAAAGFRVESAKPWSPFEIDAPGKTLWIARKSTG